MRTFFTGNAQRVWNRQRFPTLSILFGLREGKKRAFFMRGVATTSCSSQTNRNTYISTAGKKGKKGEKKRLCCCRRKRIVRVGHREQVPFVSREKRGGAAGEGVENGRGESGGAGNRILYLDFKIRGSRGGITLDSPDGWGDHKILTRLIHQEKKRKEGKCRLKFRGGEK